MSNKLLILDISHHGLSVSEFDLKAGSSLRPEHYSFMDYRDIHAAIEDCFRQGLGRLPQACCVICDAIITPEWLVFSHNPQMRLSVQWLKSLLGLKQVTFMSSADALACSAPVIQKNGFMQHLTGEDSLYTGNTVLTVEIGNTLRCRLLSKRNDVWLLSAVHSNEANFISDEPALNDFIYHYGPRALLSEKGLVLLYGYFCALGGKSVECLTFADVLMERSPNTKQETDAAKITYFKLLFHFLESKCTAADETGQGVAYAIYSSQPELFATYISQYTTATEAEAFTLSVYVNRCVMPRLQGAAAWISWNAPACQNRD